MIKKVLLTKSQWRTVIADKNPISIKKSINEKNEEEIFATINLNDKRLTQIDFKFGKKIWSMRKEEFKNLKAFIEV